MRGIWNAKRLGDVCRVDKEKHRGEPLPYVGMENMESGTGRFLGNLHPVEVKSSTFRFDSRHLLYGRLRPYLNKVLLPNFTGHCSSEVFPLRVSEDELDRRFLFYWITRSEIVSKIDEMSTGARMPRANVNQVLDFEIELPPLGEQKRIVAILDEAFASIDAAIANTEKNLINSRELFESYLNSVFGKRRNQWRELTLKEVCTDYGRGKSKHRPRNAPELYGGIYPFIQTGDVRRADHFIKEYSKTYNEKGLAQSKLWPSGTICITIAANIAETGVLEFDACFPDSLIGLVVDQTLASNSYVEFLLQSVKTVLKAKGKGSAQDNINLGTFEKEKFPFPPIEIQKKIVGDVQELRISIRRLESIYDRKTLALADLKQSLLQKAFSGELTADVAEKQVHEAVA